MAQSEHSKRPGYSAARWYVRFPRAFPIGIFVVILGLSLLSVYAIERSEDARLRAQNRQVAEALASALEARATTASAYLRAGSAFISGNDDLNGQAFGNFFNEMREDARYSGVVGIGWAPRITADERQRLIDEMSEEDNPDFLLDSEAEGDLTPVRFVNPATLTNRNLIGYDLSGEQSLRAALDEAEEAERTVATAPVAFGETVDGDVIPAFFIVMPVFDSSFGYRELRGFVFSRFAADEFLEAALEAEALEGTSVELLDAAQAAAGGGVLARVGANGLDDGGSMVSKSLSVAGREWTLRISAPASQPLSNLSLATLLFGLLASILILAIVRLLTAQASEDREALVWLEEQNAIRNTLTRELNHRVKNTLANVLSIVSLTRRRSDDLDDFADSLGGRIRALSATHDLLTQSDWGTTPIASVLETEIAPYRQAEDQHIVLDGPAVELAPNDALSLGLAIHELATNASKYGALSVVDGRLDVTWEMVGDDLARLRWQESNGPAVPQDRQDGFGTELIRKIVAHELRNPVDLRFDPAGVSCTLTVPVRRPSEFGLRAPKPVDVPAQ